MLFLKARAEQTLKVRSGCPGLTGDRVHEAGRPGWEWGVVVPRELCHGVHVGR